MRFIVILFALLVIGCGKNEIREPLLYEGPSRQAEDVELYYSENDKVKIKMIAAVLYEFENGDYEFPKGIFMEFYDEAGKIESTLQANEAHYFKKDDQWRGRGRVEVKNTAKKEQLNTEELFWKPSTKKIFTEKFVTITSPDNVIYGEGLEANDDLTDYTIRKVTGDLILED